MQKAVESKLRETLGLTAKEADETFKACLEAIKEAIKEDKELRLRGFGTFKTVHKPARPGRNPATGESIMISARNAIQFKAGKDLKELIN